MLVAPRTRACAAENRIVAWITDCGNVVTIVPAVCPNVSAEDRLSVPGPEVADAAVTWTVSCWPQS